MKDDAELWFDKQVRAAEARTRRATEALGKLVLRPWREIMPPPDANHDERDAAYWLRFQRQRLAKWDKIEKAFHRWQREAHGVYEIGLWAKALGDLPHKRENMHESAAFHENADGVLLSPRHHFWHPIQNCFGAVLTHAQQAALLGLRWFMAREALGEAWELEAVKLALGGKTATEIGKALGKPTSTITRAVKRHIPRWTWRAPAPGKEQRRGDMGDVADVADES